MNVQEVWRQGITGRNIVVTILDDGLEFTHPDLRQNYVRNSHAYKVFFFLIDQILGAAGEF